MREVAQGPMGQATVIRRSHALSEGGRSFEGNDPADGGDRAGHTGLADRVGAIKSPCSATGLTVKSICPSNLIFYLAQISQNL